jgi:1-deoxy-D-xylulose-5-phosphate synthase
VTNEVKERFNKNTIVNAIFQKPIDVELLKTLLNKKQIVIYDIYGTEEGFASIVKEELNKLSYKGIVKSLCVPSTFIKHGSVNEQIIDLGLSLDDLAKVL